MSADNKHTTKNKKKIYTVYKHTAPNGKVYIGITRQKPEYRWNNGNNYKGSPHFYCAILKYGWENIKHEIVEDGLTKQQACDLEKELIEKYHATDQRYGYNISTGGESGALGIHHSIETRLRMSESRKGHHVSPETRKKISESNKRAYLLNPERRMELSESHKGINNPNYGKHPSAETLRKRSESLKRAYRNPERRQELRNRAKKRKVVCVETGTLYGSITEAAKSIGVAYSTIANVLGGFKKSGGCYHWRYAENME